ncbi:MAG: methionyl-tRNA formyltransferase, partial [Lachnospiraceae bacterium]|nr:methionyl-tRNA formyltransferase [Lachnospiraceae bacterium]
TGNGLLELLEVQAEGKKRMNFADFLRGNKVEEQTKLG